MANALREGGHKLDACRTVAGNSHYEAQDASRELRQRRSWLRNPAFGDKAQSLTIAVAFQSGAAHSGPGVTGE